MLFKNPIQTFTDWLKKRSQTATPVQPVRGGAQAAAQTQKPQLGPNEIDPAELRDQWDADERSGITPNQRAAANKNNPIISDEREQALRNMFNSSQQANHMGITPEQRAAANKNNPKISDETLNRLQDIWNNPQEEY
jgi:hypothetical protein